MDKPVDGASLDLEWVVVGLDRRDAALVSRLIEVFSCPLNHRRVRPIHILQQLSNQRGSCPQNELTCCVCGEFSLFRALNWMLKGFLLRWT